MVARFIDTSVLCNLVPVPGRDQERREVRDEQRTFVAAGDTLLLPLAAVIETGNFIAQLDGRRAREAAERLTRLLHLSASRQAPYDLHDVTWDAGFVERLVAGAGTGTSLVDHAQRGLGAGDLTILTEVEAYRKRARIEVTVWSRDAQLAAYG